MQKNEIPFEKLKRAILKAYSAGYRKIGITGGEPLLYSHFEDLFELLGKLKVWVFMETNGCLLTEEKLLFMKHHLQDELEILTSLDSHVEEINDCMRGHGAFRTCLDTLELIKSYKIKPVLNAVVTRQNLDTVESIESYIRFARDLGVHQIYFSSVVDLGRAREEIFFLPPSQRRVMREVLEKNDYYRGFVGGHCAFHLRESSASCVRLALRHNAVSPGGIHPCVYQENIRLGAIEDFEHLINDQHLMDSLDDLRRAALTDCHSDFMDCHECARLMHAYVRKIKDSVTIDEERAPAADS